MFGRLLALVDGAELDEESFYCACLLHDFGLTEQVAAQDFTLRSARRARSLAATHGASPEQAERIADGICGHTTPGVTPQRDGPLACYVQSGAMVDVGGLRLVDVAPANRAHVLRAHPRGAFKRELSELVREEARAVPKGRFALLFRFGFVPAIKAAPFDG